ncbi:hypothetical protein [Pedobacter africanus]|uniref:Uncharacterized protein n=1 Tax=Pedobacter africanus TaxID=151894 RepID=A0A1W2ACA1_9SPHI|nr:hypothetical protein [Pedobacter africanus]SMC58349.1 hypothetical protein SAMN04488524_1298 [Pedobacter africanus]
MNLATSIYQHLKQRISKKFLLIFSLSSLTLGGVVWACADYGFDYEYSSFSPEAFVAKDYTPFFYTEYISYYGGGYGSPYESNTSRYNAAVTNDWYAYFDQKLEKPALEYLLFKASAKGIDSAYNNFKGKSNELPKSAAQLKSLQLNKKKVHGFFDYLQLAKSCESFAATDIVYSWDPQPKIEAPAQMEQTLQQHFKITKDKFIKQRVWFQLVRYYHFSERNDSTLSANASKTLKTFDEYKDAFPKNMMYYRALGYVAGWHYKHGNYALSNYLNSLCYDYSHEAKIPSEWSFRPLEEADWQKTLGLARTSAEKITLWHLLGIHYDPQRAINEIMKLEPKSEKLDLLLSRIINISEYDVNGSYQTNPDTAVKRVLKQNIDLVSGIALKNNTAKPYFWNLAAGYLNFMDGNNLAAAKFYDKAKKQLPAGDKLLMAQYKILDWTLFISGLKKIDAATEAKMTEPLNWFADLNNGKDTIPSLRFARALQESINSIAALYKKQGDLVKSNAFKSYHEFYANNQNIERMKSFLQKPDKTAFEQAMLRYYPYDLNDLYVHQSLVLTYQDKLDEAIAIFDKLGNQGGELPANPFNMRLNDCHDCDHAMKQPKKLNDIDVLRTMQKIKAEIKAGKNVSGNAYLLANAFYNLSFYGNARSYYQTGIMSADGATPFDIPEVFKPMLLSNKIAEKYYLMAANATQSKELKARYTFMAAKCERNESYNRGYINPEKKDANYWNTDINEVFFGKYFATLKQQYSDTRFYREAIQECGYFSSYDKKY